MTSAASRLRGKLAPALGGDADGDAIEPFLQVAKEFNATVIPVGRAWFMAEKARPELSWSNPDGTHPGFHRAYLCNCVFFAALTGESPVGNPYCAVIRGEAEVNKEDAAFPQEAAWQAWQEVNQAYPKNRPLLAR